MKFDDIISFLIDPEGDHGLNFQKHNTMVDIMDNKFRTVCSILYDNCTNNAQYSSRYAKFVSVNNDGTIPEIVIHTKKTATNFNEPAFDLLRRNVDEEFDSSYFLHILAADMEGDDFRGAEKIIAFYHKLLESPVKCAKIVFNDLNQIQ